MATVVIAADGNAERWGDHQPAKWLIDVDGERLIDRTIRQARQYSDNIVVIGNPDWNLDAPTFPTQSVTNSEADKLLCGRRFWDWNDTTIHLYGDVYYTDEAMETIFTTRPEPWHMFCRKDGSSLTGCGHGELWAYSFTPEAHHDMDMALAHVVEGYRTTTLTRPAGWATYRSLSRKPLNTHHLYDRFTLIDDWTEDFDKPDDYANWLRRRQAINRPARLSVAIMAHPSREQWAHQLATQLDATIVWDTIGSEWDTGRRAWLAADPEATHHAVIQDDAIACDDLTPGVEHMLNQLPYPQVLGLYVGTRRPEAVRVNAAATKARQINASWLQHNRLLWGVGIVLPTPMIPQMLNAIDSKRTSYDRRISDWLIKQNLTTYYPFPSPLDHQGDQSLVGKRKPQRRAHQHTQGSLLAQPIDGPAIRISNGMVVPAHTRGRTQHQTVA